MGEYCEQLYISKLGNLDGMDKFPETHHPPRTNREEQHRRPLTSKGFGESGDPCS